MQQFTIRDIEHLTGIKAHTLRIWEQRYAFFKPQRKESRHRFYDNEDLKKLLRISALYHSGMRVSGINALGEDEILQQVRGLIKEAGNNEVYIVRMIEAALDFDEKVFTNVLNQTITDIGFEKTIVDICYPFLIRVGLLWSTNNVIPAQEHFSSYLVQQKIISETDRLPAPALSARTILLFTPSGEHHEMPLLFINYLLKKTGWSTIYLGAGKSLPLIHEIVSSRSVTHIYIHLLTNLTGFEVNDYLERVCTGFPDQQVLLSGPATKAVQRNFLNLTSLSSDEEIKNFIGVTI